MFTQEILELAEAMAAKAGTHVPIGSYNVVYRCICSKAYYFAFHTFKAFLEDCGVLLDGGGMGSEHKRLEVLVSHLSVPMVDSHISLMRDLAPRCSHLYTLKRLRVKADYHFSGPPVSNQDAQDSINRARQLKLSIDLCYAGGGLDDNVADFIIEETRKLQQNIQPSQSTGLTTSSSLNAVKVVPRRGP